MTSHCVVSPSWVYGFVIQTCLSDDAKEKLCRSIVNFISDRSTTAWQVARWRRVKNLISGLNTPGGSLSQFWCDSGGTSETESSFATDLASQPSLCLGFEPPLELMIRSLLLVVTYCFVFSFWSFLSAEMTVSPFVYNICFCNIRFIFLFFIIIMFLIFVYIFRFYIYFFPSFSFLSLYLSQAAWCAANHASAVPQFRHLNGRTRERHQVSVFYVSVPFSYAANILIVLILNDFCLLPAYLCYEVIYIRNLELGMHIMPGWCAFW
jgi:hypothetical protein